MQRMLCARMGQTSACFKLAAAPSLLHGHVPRCRDHLCFSLSGQMQATYEDARIVEKEGSERKVQVRKSRKGQM